MELSSLEESNNHHNHNTAVVKRRRTKRPRQGSMANISSSSSSAEFSGSTTEEDEDTAHCLILLAQGRALVDQDPEPTGPKSEKPSELCSGPSPPPTTYGGGAGNSTKSERYTSRKYTEAAATADGGKAGFYVYECKTCNKCFSSFQALGGHRASHKKAKIAAEEIIKNPVTDIIIAADDTALHIGISTAAAAATTTDNPSSPPKLPVMNVPNANSTSSSKMTNPRVHECTICGAEFTSGQALGGHMRRHRPLSLTTPETSSKERVVPGLELDLNLPAPSDEESTVFETSPPPPPPSFRFGGKQTSLMLSASALVDCHY